MAAVLKTAWLKGLVSSNLTTSATKQFRRKFQQSKFFHFMPQKVTDFISNKKVYFIILITAIIIAVALSVVFWNSSKPKEEAKTTTTSSTSVAEPAKTGTQEKPTTPQIPAPATLPIK
jgi:hypothetical protein